MKGNLLLKDLKDVMPEIVFNIFKEKIIDFFFLFRDDTKEKQLEIRIPEIIIM